MCRCCSVLSFDVFISSLVLYVIIIFVDHLHTWRQCLWPLVLRLSLPPSHLPVVTFHHEAMSVSTCVLCVIIIHQLCVGVNLSIISLSCSPRWIIIKLDWWFEHIDLLHLTPRLTSVTCFMAQAIALSLSFSCCIWILFSFIFTWPLESHRTLYYLSSTRWVSL